MNVKRQAMMAMIIKDSVRNKFQSYKPETDKMPFHYRLLGKDRMALFSFIQSLNTTFGVSIYEPVAIALARDKYKVAKAQVETYNQISNAAHQQIQTIMDGLRAANRETNKISEVEEIRKVCREGNINQVNLTRVDLWLERNDGELLLFDLKTVKPNKDGIEKYKLTLLEWTAAELAREPRAVINTIIGFPYNPYHPKPYSRWTLRGMLDLDHEVLIAEELWDFIGGEGTYVELLNAFEQAGIELRDEIDVYFRQFS